MNKWHKVKTPDDWPKVEGEYLVKAWVPDCHGKHIEKACVSLFNADPGWVLDGMIVVAWMPIPGDDEETAHWDGWICSRCHEEAPAEVNGGYYESNYCPNCGAKMDGGNDE